MFFPEMGTDVLHSQKKVESYPTTGFSKVDSEIDILKANLNFSRKVVIDIGCGTGKISKMIASEAAFVIGIDTPDLIGMAKKYYQPDNFILKTGSGQNMPVESNYADIIICYASFHHIPENEMNIAMRECYRVLKEDGLLVMCEPLTDKGSYYDLVSLIEDERVIRKIIRWKNRS